MTADAEAEQICFKIDIRGSISIISTPYPHFKKPWLNRAFQAVLQKAPRITTALLRERTLGHIHNYPIVLRHPREMPEQSALKKLARWLNRNRRLRLVYLLMEGLVLPLTPFMALLPGPNIFFYIPALLFYFHLASFRSLRPETIALELKKCILVAE